MSFAYFPHTPDDIRQMLHRSGVSSIEELYSDIPENLRFKGEYDLPDAMSEDEVRRYFEDLDRRNARLTVFCGAGAYDHYTPAAVKHIISRSEFQTAYTPYQAEISQGTLRYIFEFQSMICELTGMDCANASMYADVYGFIEEKEEGADIFVPASECYRCNQDIYRISRSAA